MRKHPIAFVIDALGVAPEPWQAEALALVASNDRVAIRSGHGVGKSALLAWLILWWLVTRFPARVPCTAPTAHQLNDVLWGELARWHRDLREPFRSWLTLKSDRVELADAPNESFAVARTARPEQPEAFQGFHSENLLFLVDEASGVDETIFEVGAGSMSTPGAKTVMAGNPTRASGYFHRAFHDLRPHWATMRVSSLQVPRAGGHVGDIEATYGRDSNAWRVRVLGEFPTQADETVIALELVEAAIKRKVEPDYAFREVWGVDVARFGDDRTALARRRGNALVAPVESWRGKDTMQTTGVIKAAYESIAEPARPSEIIVDVIGVGAGVVDRLVELGLPVRGVNVAEQPAASDRFLRLRDELWWKARDWFQARAATLPDDLKPGMRDLVAELTAPTYGFTSAGKILVESKDEMKKRGLRSPDLADAFVLTFAGGLDRVEAHDQERYGRRRAAKGSWMSV
ncbi:MAG: terminase B [Alphaproteobacteria bacterium]